MPDIGESNIVLVQYMLITGHLTCCIKELICRWFDFVNVPIKNGDSILPVADTVFNNVK